MINFQPIEKKVVSDGSVLSVHSIFNTIQGEGPFTGRPATFVRLAGCNLQCPQCDTVYTGDGVQNMPIVDIVATVDAAQFVVITGGEPFRQNILMLCKNLIEEGATVQVETNGTLPVPDGLPPDVVIVCSPKTSKVHPSIAERAACFKYVMSADSVAGDGLPERVLGNPSKVYKPKTHKVVYLQPVDVQDKAENDRNLKACVASCMENGYTLQLQIHKLIGVD